MWVTKRSLQLLVLAILSGLILTAGKVSAAINPLPTPAPGSSSYGLEATKEQPPPTRGATITTPGSGASFSTIPITVSGICPADLLVQVYDNAVMVGSTMCKGGSFTMQIGLFSGQNDLTASVFDDLDQVGPESNTVTVTYNNATFTTFGSLITLSSNYGRRAANPGSTLDWPILLSGGTGPYAFSLDWGDGKPAELKSQGLAGTVNISHVYDKSGIYQVLVKATDANGATAFLQLIAVANGNVGTSGNSSKEDSKAAASKAQVMWLPTLVAFVLLIPAFWLGRRSELVTLHKRLQKEADEFKEL